MWVKDQLDQISDGGIAAHEAALELGLLLERRQRSGDMSEEIRKTCGDALAERHLTDAEAEEAVEGLLRIVDADSLPHPMAIWALTKTADARIVASLLKLFDRVLKKPDQEHLALQALHGLALFDTPATLAAIHKAAAEGVGGVQADAQQYVSIHEGGHHQ